MKSAAGIFRIVLGSKTGIGGRGEGAERLIVLYSNIHIERFGYIQ